MSRVRSSMVLLGICVVALLIGSLRVATETTPLPTGSSYSTQPDGAQALYDWATTVGATSSRLTAQGPADDRSPDAQTPATLLVIQPETMLDATAREALDAVPRHGGTLVVAGDSLPWLLYARGLGITVEPIRTGARTASTPDGGLTLPLVARYRVRADGATALLVDPAGDWLALRMPYLQGALIVLATPQPLTNAALNDPSTARFVFREVMSAAVGYPFIVEEAHHSFAPLVAGGPATINQLLFETAPGRAVIFAAVLTFVFVLLNGRRLGPAIPARPSTEMRRTMYEHVQMLANLYRRAGQFGVVKTAFSRYYARLLARGATGPPGRAAALAAALARVEGARTEAELVGAVAAAQPDA